MLDNFMDSLRRGASKVRSRGEELAQATRLRLEIYQLGRELDALYARLGRAYHANSNVDILTPIREDIVRVDAEITAREQLLAEIDAADGEAAAVMDDGTHGASEPAPSARTEIIAPSPFPTAPRDVDVPVSSARVSNGAPAVEPTPEASVTATPGAPSAASVFLAKSQESGADPDRSPSTPHTVQEDER